ncbi:MAG: NAD(+) synthase [Atopobiaceae bacterium]|jgi:NAD+ synthase (glutamine-hydrolysing)|uniref:Glutamine-dependent NAD(+) synthetase n=1 Tax=Muricaecibacterium torontonense TaxID=3032871 RepID=A0A4S2F453_9ACTN|nr:NAD(+) synthase [Muricaecibacterium torontonense]MCI8676154.1 NAD(+) synthase [Atopobiaceae bacterium]TGY63252.1 NAD(+) synthase [Muricaecibacterium torontonense]
MKLGLTTVAAVTPAVHVGDVDFNVVACVEETKSAVAHGAQVVILPECVLTAYTCNDLFWQDALLVAAECGLASYIERTAELGCLSVVGLPLRVNSKLYNVAAVCCAGELLGVVPKLHIPTYNEFYEGRYFEPGPVECTPISVAGRWKVPFGAHQVFEAPAMEHFCVGVEICEDLWVPEPPSIGLTKAGATLICNLSASNAQVGKAAYRRDLVRGQSARLVCAYGYASSGWGESTQDVVFSGHDLVCQDGRIVAEAQPFGGGVALGQVDLEYVASERRRMSTYRTSASPEAAGYTRISLPESFDPADEQVTGWVDPHPFVPDDPATRSQRCEDILDIQARGLAQRLAHTHAKCAVVGVSGGLDSTLALLVCARAFDYCGLDRGGILAVTMPGFGTTHRTHSNARTLAEALGAQLLEVPIAAAVRQHFQDIGHNEAIHDVTYENSQARERTQILMDLANQRGGLVIGTGDLSELALGWATYNGDHMSMYGVNSGVPKTLVRHLVRHVAATCDNPQLAEVLLDVLDTPVSPELLPAQKDGTIAQVTEDLVGPYELHDFFLYAMLRQCFGPAKIYQLALAAFVEQPRAQGQEPLYDPAAILRWLRTFYQRFFAQQFKRSCLPDGPKVGSVAVSPRGDLRMPSDASATLWLAQVDALETPQG